VQAVVYPSFRYAEADTFRAWHRVYTRRMGYIVAPLMIAQLATAATHFLLSPSNLLSILHVSLVAGAWAATFLISVPLHKKLQAIGKCPDTLSNLVSTNWIRTAMWTVALGVNLAHLPAS
jgi:hypothetical protein